MKIAEDKSTVGLRDVTAAAVNAGVLPASRVSATPLVEPTDRLHIPTGAARGFAALRLSSWVAQIVGSSLQRLESSTKATDL